MKRPNAALNMELLEKRETPSAPGFLVGAGINLIASNVHYGGPHSSKTYTGTVTVINPHRATGKFDVVVIWAQGVDGRGRPTGKTSVVGYDTENVSAPNNGARSAHGIKVNSHAVKPSWAKFLVAEVNPFGHVTETTTSDDFISIRV
jgi:hypothetical protein